MNIAAIRQILERAVVEVRASDVPELVGLLEMAKVRAIARALTPAPPTAEVVDVATLAAELDLAESWLRTQARTGKLPHIRCGKYIQFRRSEVLAALDHRMRTPDSAEKRSTGAGAPRAATGEHC